MLKRCSYSKIVKCLVEAPLSPYRNIYRIISLTKEAILIEKKFVIIWDTSLNPFTFSLHLTAHYLHLLYYCNAEASTVKRRLNLFRVKYILYVQYGTTILPFFMTANCGVQYSTLHYSYSTVLYYYCTLRSTS